TGQDPSGEDVTATSEDPNPLTPDDDGYDPDCPNCTVTPLDQIPSLSLIKATTFSGKASMGDVIGYTFTVENTGNVTIENITVNDPLLGGLVDNSTGVWPSVVGTLAPRQSVTLTGSYTVTEADVLAGEVVNIATVRGDDPINPGETLPEEPSEEVTVEIMPFVIVANDDVFGPINGTTGGTLPGNVLDNDTLNGEPVNPEEVILTPINVDPDSPVVINPDGTVTVAPNTPAGEYTLEYRICEVLNPDNCDIATVTVTVEVSGMILGTVFNDANGNVAIDGEEMGYLPGGVPHFVYLVDALGVIRGVSEVNADGTFAIPIEDNTGSFSLQISTNTYVLGEDAVIEQNLPLGFVHTGESVGLGSDGTADGVVNIELVSGSGDLSGILFGIQERPIAGSGSLILVNQNGNFQHTVFDFAFNFLE
ncbi:hypothetical protein ACFOUP_08075, partial [Belliella kenyensis]